MARQASPLTLAVRKLLDQSKGKITASEALPKLVELGFKETELNLHAINQIKANWKARKDGSKPAPSAAKSTKKAGKSKVAVTQDEALAFIREHGGLKSAKAFVQRQIALVREAESALVALS